MSVLLTLLLHFSPPSPATPQEPELPFRALDHEAAFVTAAEEGRMVLACFEVDDSDDCGRMRETTWLDEAVQRYLEVETVAIAVDGAERGELVERYGIEAFPTVVVWTPDGVEVDRLRGYTKPRIFVARFRGMLEARELILTARAGVAAAPEDAMARLHLARALATGNGWASALEQYAWVWDHARAPEQERERLAMVLTELTALSARYPPARKQMAKWRRRSIEALEGGELEARLVAAKEVSALSRHLKEPEVMLELYLQKRDAEDVPAELVDALFDEQVVRQLFYQRRYEELIAGLRDPLVRVDAQLTELDELRARLADGSLPKEQAATIDVTRTGVLTSAGMYFEALLRVGRRDDAVELKDYVVTRESIAQSYVLLMRAANRARERDLAKQIGTDGLAVLVKKQRLELERAYQQMFLEE